MERATVTDVPVVWKMKESEAKRLLGKAGRPVLDQVIDLMKRYANSQEWPVEQINICYAQDMEFPDWETIEVNPVFDAPPDKCEEYIHRFLQGEADKFRDALGKRQRRAYIRIIQFDFETLQCL